MAKHWLIYNFFTKFLFIIVFVFFFLFFLLFYILNFGFLRLYIPNEVRDIVKPRMIILGKLKRERKRVCSSFWTFEFW